MNPKVANKAYAILTATGGPYKLVRDLNRLADQGYRLHTIQGEWYVMELDGRFGNGRSDDV